MKWGEFLALMQLDEVGVEAAVVERLIHAVPHLSDLTLARVAEAVEAEMVRRVSVAEKS